MKLIERFLLIFIVLIGIHRMDLASGKLSFVLSPVLLCSLLLIFVFGLLLTYSGGIRIPRILLVFLLLQCLLCGWLFVSNIDFRDFIQIKRSILFCIIQMSTTAFIVLFYQVKDKYKFLTRFLHISLNIYLFFSLIQAAYFISGQFGDTFVEPFSFVLLQPRTISYYFPRITGGFTDPNVGGFFLTFVFLLFKHLHIGGWRVKVIPVLILATLSRSSIAAFLAVLLVRKAVPFLMTHNLLRFSARIRIKLLRRFLIASGAFIIAIIVLAETTDFFNKLIIGVQARLFNRDNSTSIHLALIETALDGIFQDGWHFIKGYGFGSSFLYTQEFFPGEKQGNFHSELLTIFFETGLIGLLFYLSFFLIPLAGILFSGKFSRNLNLSLIVVAALLQGIFYQQFLFNYYWIILSLLWLLPFVKEDLALQEPAV